MTDIRARLAEAIRDAHYRIVGGSSDVRVDPGDVLADVLLSLPGIAIVDTDATETVAKAIFANRRHHEPVHAWDDLYPDEMDSYRNMARAALLAAGNAVEAVQ
jgi:hypothetical protein